MIHTFFFYYFVICVGIFCILIVCLVIGRQYAQTKDIQEKEEESQKKIYKALMTVRSQCEMLQKGLKLDCPLSSSYSHLKCSGIIGKKGKKPLSSSIIIVNQHIERHQCGKCIDIYNRTQQGLDEIQQTLKIPKPIKKQTERTPLLSHMGVLIIGLILKIQILTGLLCLLTFWVIKICFASLSIVCNIQIPQLSLTIFQNCNIGKICSPSLMYLWIIVAVSFLVFAIMLIREIIKNVGRQCSILLMGYRISSIILFSENVNETHIMEDVDQAIKDINKKYSSNCLSRFLRKSTC